MRFSFSASCLLNLVEVVLYMLARKQYEFRISRLFQVVRSGLILVRILPRFYQPRYTDVITTNLLGDFGQHRRERSDLQQVRSAC